MDCSTSRLGIVVHSSAHVFLFYICNWGGAFPIHIHLLAHSPLLANTSLLNLPNCSCSWSHSLRELTRNHALEMQGMIERSEHQTCRFSEHYRPTGASLSTPTPALYHSA